MPSPDLSPFIDLSLNDATAQSLFEKSQVRFLELVPEWIARESNIEVLLMEALSLQVSELVYAINRVPNNVVQGLLALQGQIRDAGAAPTVNLAFTMVDDAGYVIPAGSQVLVESGEIQMIFTTTALLNIPALSTTGSVESVGTDLSSLLNGISSAELSLINGLIYVAEVTLFSTIVGGLDAESDVEYFARATALFQRMTTTLILPSHFVTYALGVAGVFRAYVLDNYDSTDSGAVPGDSGGHVTVSVYGEVAALSNPAKESIEVAMEALSVANLFVHVQDAVINTVDVTVTVQGLPDTDPYTVQASVVSALTSYLSTAKWDWSDTVLRNNLIAVITNVVGVSYVVTLTVPAADVTFLTFGNLAVLGTCIVTVV